MEAVITWEVLAYFMSLYGTKIFSDLGGMVSNYNTLSDDKILQIDKWAVGVSKEAPELTGGVEVGTTVMDLSYDNDNLQYIATQTGTLFTVKAPALVKGLLNALGVNVTTTDTVSEKIAAALSLAFDTSITVANMNDYSIPILLKNGITYLSENIVKALSNALFDEGVFNTSSVLDRQYITANSQNELTIAAPSGAYISTLISLCYSRYVLLNNVYMRYINEIVTAMNTITSLGNAALSSSYGVLANACSISAVKRPNYLQFDVTLIHIPNISNGILTTYVDNNYYTTSYSQYVWGTSGVFYIWLTDGHVQYNTDNLVARETSGTFSTGLNTISSGEGFNCPLSIGNVISHGIEGIDIQIGATTPSDNDIDVETKYPSWAQRQIEIGWYDKVPALLRRGKALPIDLQDALTEEDDFATDQTTAQTGTLDDADTDATTTAVKGATLVIPALVTIDEETRVDPADIPDVVPEPTPPVVIPTGTTSAGLATIYNPTEAQVNALKGDLWSQNIITTLQSIFLNNPMDAIISLSKVFCTPHTNGTATIKLGYVQTSVTSVKTVDDQYTTIDCGTVNVPEIYGNTTDYEPYTNVSIFLPFIGIQNLSAKDVVGGKLQIIYRVDVTTGTCIAQLFVTKDGVKQMLYSFEGNCAVEIPLSGSNANRAIIGLASIAASTVAPGAGLALAGGAMNLVNGVNLQRSGGFQSNAGAMNNKKPYLIINRVLPYEASGYNQIYGYPSNNRVLLNSVTGYTRVKEVHVEGINCTDYEKNMIEEQLKAGILL